MLAYVSTGPRDFGRHPLASTTRDHWEFYAVLTGRIAPTFPDQSASPALREARFWLFRPDCRHGWRGHPDKKSTVAVFHFTAVPEELNTLTAPTGWAEVRTTAKDRTALGRIARSAQPLVWNSDPLLKFHSQEVLMRLTVLFLSHTLTPAKPKPMSAKLRLDAAELWLRRHFDESPGVRDIARLVGVGESHLRRLFLEETGHTPKAWMLNLQLAVAKEHLASGNDKLDTIAALSGFSSCSTLCHAFRKATGHTPAAWRKSNPPDRPPSPGLAPFGENRPSPAATRESAQPAG